MRLKKSEIERAALANRFTISASGAAVARATGLTGAEKARASRQERATREFCTAEHLAHAMGGTVRRAHAASETRVTLYPFGPPCGLITNYYRPVTEVRYNLSRVKSESRWIFAMPFQTASFRASKFKVAVPSRSLRRSIHSRVQALSESWHITADIWTSAPRGLSLLASLSTKLIENEIVRRDLIWIE
jgi:hypothetical protein